MSSLNNKHIMNNPVIHELGRVYLNFIMIEMYKFISTSLQGKVNDFRWQPAEQVFLK